MRTSCRSSTSLDLTLRRRPDFAKRAADHPRSLELYTNATMASVATRGAVTDMAIMTERKDTPVPADE